MDFNFDLEKRFQLQHNQDIAPLSESDFDNPGEDELLESMNSTPLGRLLKLIATLPEVRREKVVHLRERLHQGNYDEQEYLDEALDRVIEELISES